MPALSKKNKNKADINNTEDFDDVALDDSIDGLEGSSKKSKKKEKKEKKPKSGKGKAGLIVFLIIIAAIAAFVVGVIKFNFLGLRDNQLRGVLEKVPVVNNMLPPLEGEDPTLQMSQEELLNEVSRLNGELEKLNEENERLNTLNSTYLGEISVLREFEENQLQFREDKEAFDREVGMGDTVAYENYYEQISPENAENIYREVVGINADNKEFKDFVSTYQNMDESSAAEIFDQMVRTDLDLVVRILTNISSDKRAEILSNMTTTAAEQVTRRMAPVQ